MILGVAYHSPLDVMSMLPLDTLVTLNPGDDADVLITDYIEKKYESRLQLVFTSARTLFKANLPIIDQGPWGRIVDLTEVELERILGKGRKDATESRTHPSWVRI